MTAVPDVLTPLEYEAAPQRIAPTRAAELLAHPVQTDDTAAELLMMSSSQVQRLRQAGHLPTIRVGRLTRIPTPALIDWINNEAVTS